MKTSLTLLSVIISVSAFGQTSVYHPFPDSNAIWNISAQGCCWTDCPPPPATNPVLDDYNFSYSISGDTIINSVAYHKLYKSGSVHTHCNFGNYIDYWNSFNDYCGAIRQDTFLRKVYFSGSSSSECLLYDFTSTIGDTIDRCDCPATVTSIDSILIGSNYRKRFNLGQYSIIEGIGSTSGLLEPLCPFEYYGNLVCFSENEQTLYPDTTITCALLTTVKNISSPISKGTIFPNPFHTTATLELRTNFKTCELNFYNTLGEPVRHLKIISKTTIINRDGLEGGIYFYQVTNENGIWITGMLIIE